MSGVLGDEPFFDDGFCWFERAIFVAGFPEPAIGEGDAGLGRDRAFGGWVLTSVLLEGFDVTVVERGRGVLACVELGNDAVWLEFFHEGVYFVERDFGVGDPAPGGVPSIEYEHGDFAVVCEEFGELVFDELDFFGRDIEVADVVAEIEDAVVEAGLDVEVVARFDEFGDDIDGAVIDFGFGGPDGEAVVMLGGEAGILHVGALGGGKPLIGIEGGGVECARCTGGVAPFAVLECGHVEVEEHAEAEVEEFLLELEEGFVLVIFFDGGFWHCGEFGDEGCGGESSGGLQDFASGGHGVYSS